MSAAVSSARRTYLDWARGLAVLLMIEAHTLDAWTLPSARATAPFRYAGFLGGFAAPWFLWLAGVALVLCAARAFERTGNRAKACEVVCRRGVQVFLFAFLFRLQAFIVSPGSHPITLFRVDILNVMGPAMVAAGVLWMLAPNRAALIAIYAVAALAIAFVTPWARTARAVEGLPLLLQWYMRPAGEHTTFTLLPWAGFVFAGAASGALLAGRPSGQDGRLQVVLGGAGAALVAFGAWTASRPALVAGSSFWTSSPTWFVIRVGILMAATTGLWAISRVISFAPLARFGQNSLFIYWIHVELVYGYVTWAIHHRLPVWAAISAFALFSFLMYQAIGVRDWAVDAWRHKSLVKHPNAVLR